jgi:hypothetical protein
MADELKILIDFIQNKNPNKSLFESSSVTTAVRNSSFITNFKKVTAISKNQKRGKEVVVTFVLTPLVKKDAKEAQKAHLDRMKQSGDLKTIARFHDIKVDKVTAGKVVDSKTYELVYHFSDLFIDLTKKPLKIV